MNKKILIILILVLFNFNIQKTGAQSFENRVAGKILLDVTSNGEAWYVNPVNNIRYYLGRPDDAFAVMRSQSVGITNYNLNKIPVGILDTNNDSDGDGLNDELEDVLGSDKNNIDTDSDGYKDGNEILNGYSPIRKENKYTIDENFSKINSGKIFLQVEKKGEAWYINPSDNKRYFLGRPEVAFEIMRKLSLGISRNDLEKIKTEENIKNIGEVPFASQAPFGEWGDPRQQDGCEEVSVLMAVKWAKKETLTNTEAKKEIIAIAEYEKEKYNNYHDTSINDTAKIILSEYFNFKNFEALNGVSMEKIKEELAKGKIIIAPADGRKLNNPHFTPPGPINHMILIIGYDKIKKEFTVHDPGTRMGEKYRYSEKILEEAIRDYPTGYHTETEERIKNIITIGREG